MLCLRFAPALLLAIAVYAQAPSDLFEKAPPPVDEALRARVSKFYQAHVNGKPRLADQYVAEDSKDAFFEADKTHFKGFEITRITYEEHFTKARVVTTCDSVMLVGSRPMEVKIPLTTLWKLVDGEWFWYALPRSETVDTPFGKMTGGKGAGGSAPFANRTPAELAAEILKQVKVDRSEVRLSSYEPASAEVTVTNGMPGSINLRLEYAAFAGFKASLDRATLGSGETARIRLECKPENKAPKPTLTVQLQVEQTAQSIPIRVTFAVPPEVEAKLPK
jgi:hypothetical protein